MMRAPSTVAALSVDAELLRWLAEGGRAASVHSAFDHVINLSSQDDRLFSLAAECLDDAPWTVRAPIGRWPDIRAQRGAPVAIDDRSIAVPGLPVLELGRAQDWYTKLPAMNDSVVAHVRSAIVVLEQTSASLGVGGCGSAPVSGDRKTVASAIAEAVAHRADVLVAMLAARDDAAARSATASLVGLGPGLTPSGDDFLVGLVLVASLRGAELAGYPAILQEVLDDHGAATTDLSLVTLREALRGRTRQRIHDLLDLAVQPPNPGRDRALCAATARVIDIGHTSGADIISGIVAGFHLELRLRGLQ